MNKININDNLNEIITRLKTGALLTTSNNDDINTMSIAWGMVGIMWNKPIFIAYVRDSRYTKEILDAAKEFTINIPNDDTNRQIISICGTKSGRDIDKFKECNLTKVKTNVINSYGIQELPLTLECKVLYKQRQIEFELPKEILDRFYNNLDSGNIHTAYYAEIVDAYII